MNQSASQMFKDAGAVALPLLPAAGLVRMSRGSKHLIRNAFRALLLGTSLGGAIGGVVGVAYNVTEQKAKGAEDMVHNTLGGAAIGAAAAVGISITVDVVHNKVRKWLW